MVILPNLAPTCSHPPVGSVRRSRDDVRGFVIVLLLVIVTIVTDLAFVAIVTGLAIVAIVAIVTGLAFIVR